MLNVNPFPSLPFNETHSFLFLLPSAWPVATSMWPLSTTSLSVCRSMLSSSSTLPHVNCSSHITPYSSSSWSSQSSFSPSGKVKKISIWALYYAENSSLYSVIYFCSAACRSAYIQTLLAKENIGWNFFIFLVYILMCAKKMTDNNLKTGEKRFRLKSGKFVWIICLVFFFLFVL